MAYIDTSVLVACYCPEPLSEAAESALRRWGEPAISRLVELELYFAVALKTRARELEARAAGRVFSMFQRHLADGHYATVPIGGVEFDLARDWIGRFSVPLRAPDALHLAAAFRNDRTLVTADRELAKAAKHFGVKHRIVSRSRP